MADAVAFFEGADEIRATWFAAALAEQFRGKYGPRWFESPEAGAELVSLWEQGTETSLEEALSKIGIEVLGPGAYIREIARRLEE